MKAFLTYAKDMSVNRKMTSINSLKGTKVKSRVTELGDGRRYILP